MATPLPAVPPPPGQAPDAPPPPPDPRDPLADRANAAALDATLSKGRAALFDATLDRPIPSRMQPLLRMPHRAPAPRGAASRAKWRRSTRAATARPSRTRWPSARARRAWPRPRNSKTCASGRGRARRRRCARSAREAVARNRQLLADLEAAEAKADAALSGKSTAAVALRNAAKGVFVAAAEFGPVWNYCERPSSTFTPSSRRVYVGRPKFEFHTGSDPKSSSRSGASAWKSWKH